MVLQGSAKVHKGKGIVLWVGGGFYEGVLEGKFHWVFDKECTKADFIEGSTKEFTKVRFYWGGGSTKEFTNAGFYSGAYKRLHEAGFIWCSTKELTKTGFY